MGAGLLSPYSAVIQSQLLHKSSAVPLAGIYSNATKPATVAKQHFYFYVSRRGFRAVDGCAAAFRRIDGLTSIMRPLAPPTGPPSWLPVPSRYLNVILTSGCFSLFKKESSFLLCLIKILCFTRRRNMIRLMIQMDSERL